MSRFWIKMLWAVSLLVTAQGCASLNLDTHGASERVLSPTAELPPELAADTAPSAASGRDWSSQTRAGREAIAADDYSAAETHLFEAFDASTAFRSGDVRIDVSLGNLVRLAAIYENLGRGDESERILLVVDEIATRHRIPRRKIDSHLARYDRSRAAKFRPRPTRSDRERERRRKSRGAGSFDELIRRAAVSYDVDAALIKAVVAAESNFEPRAVSRVGAQGLMQLMPETARAMGVRRPFVPRENIRGGVRYLRSLLDRFPDLDHALAAYNAGPNAVERYGGVPPYPETEEYVVRVRNNYRRYQSSATP